MKAGERGGFKRNGSGEAKAKGVPPKAKVSRSRSAALRRP